MEQEIETSVKLSEHHSSAFLGYIDLTFCDQIYWETLVTLERKVLNFFVKLSQLLLQGTKWHDMNQEDGFVDCFLLKSVKNDMFPLKVPSGILFVCLLGFNYFELVKLILLMLFITVKLIKGLTLCYLQLHIYSGENTPGGFEGSTNNDFQID